jgi:hypothetical protein
MIADAHMKTENHSSVQQQPIASASLMMCVTWNNTPIQHQLQRKRGHSYHSRTMLTAVQSHSPATWGAVNGLGQVWKSDGKQRAGPDFLTLSFLDLSEGAEVIRNSEHRFRLSTNLTRWAELTISIYCGTLLLFLTHLLANELLPTSCNQSITWRCHLWSHSTQIHISA